MKLVIVVADGMADWRYPALDNASPIEFADAPGIDEIVRRGEVGLAQTMYDGLPLGSLVGMLGILGYHPPDYFPVGRSIFEALVLGLKFDESDMIFRCNIVSVDRDGRLADFTANRIGDARASQYLSRLDMPPGVEVHHDLSYRNVMIIRSSDLDDRELMLAEPHENVGARIDDILPLYRGQAYKPLVDLIRESRRDDLMLWLWGASRAKAFPPVSYRLVSVTALSFLSGMTTSLGGRGIMPTGATGYIGSDLKAKLDVAMHEIPNADVCLIHCNASDEEGHARDVRGKVEAIEEIDREVVRPLLRYLDGLNEPWRLWFLPDHYTVCETGRHLPDDVPYALCGSGIAHDHTLTGFSETAIAEVVRGRPVPEADTFIPRLLRG
jgi:2,3-bisphosphoglycerate-independent phosphoglycerate mutase